MPAAHQRRIKAERGPAIAFPGQLQGMDMDEPAEAPPRAIGDRSFLFKLVGALALAGVAQGLFVFERGGATIGGFALLLVGAAALLRPVMWRDRRARIALAAAAFFAVVLAADPGFLALLLYWTMLTLAAMLPRAGDFGDGWRWTLRMLGHGTLSPFMPLRDLIILQRTRRRRGSALGRLALALALPALGTIVFLALFAAANPVIDDFLNRFDAGLNPEIFVRPTFAGLIFLAAWSLLRPPRLPFWNSLTPPFAATGEALPGVTAISVTLSLCAFNLVFAVQNGLDLIFLWSGAALPGDLTLAGYAHRGAYPLIATALLAGLFVLVTLRPGSETARSRGIRMLVTLWIAQNLLLVASTMYRTFDYVEAYSLTVLRISALIWMGLVAVGLVLICWRLLMNRSAAWLINANMLVVLLVLAGCTGVDLGGMAAAWNVRHAREVGGRGVDLDICYLRELGPSALLPLLELEARDDLPATLRSRAQGERVRIMRDLAARQADWHGWTLRGADRLADAQRLVAEHRLPVAGGDYVNCAPAPIMVSAPPPAADFSTVRPADQNALLPEANESPAPLTGNQVR
jgi:hypothetical protein